MATQNIRITGPTPLPFEVLEAMNRQPLSHRSDEFRVRLRRIVSRLCPLFGTNISPMLFTTSGTGGLEAAIVNTIAPGQRVLAVRAGMFGDRFAEIARSFGANVCDLNLPWGRAVDPDELRKHLRSAGSFRAVLLTHNESSTGVLHPLRDLARIIHEESDALILVDGVSSVGATPVRMNDWGIDVVITASQKALMSPPGISIISAGERALDVAARSGSRRFFFDFQRMKAAIENGTTTYTPAISVILGLDAALMIIENEGIENVYRRHTDIARKCRRGLRDAGLECFVTDSIASPTITSVLLPTDRPASLVRRRLEIEHGVLLSQGRGDWKERMLRIGHMGYVTAEDISEVHKALAEVISN
jgi:aspartate aminotransferase-like enzyme